MLYLIKKSIFFLKGCQKNTKIAIATNAVQETLNICLKNLKINKFVNYAICNENLNNSKPNP